MIKKRKDSLLAAKRKGKEKVCLFCKDKTAPCWEDYEKLKEYLSPRARIIASQYSGVCSGHQKRVAQAIKQARHLALLPFTTQ
ncbi:MAG: 30S ribosomal protein S18 [Candidatus Shapirobacteria bacterium]